MLVKTIESVVTAKRSQVLRLRKQKMHTRKFNSEFPAARNIVALGAKSEIRSFIPAKKTQSMLRKIFMYRLHIINCRLRFHTQLGD